MRNNKIKYYKIDLLNQNEIRKIQLLSSEVDESIELKTGDISKYTSLDRSGSDTQKLMNYICEVRETIKGESLPLYNIEQSDDDLLNLMIK